MRVAQGRGSWASRATGPEDAREGSEMDDMMLQSLRLSADLIVATIEQEQIGSEKATELMALWHSIRKVTGYPQHHGL